MQEITPVNNMLYFSSEVKVRSPKKWEAPNFFRHFTQKFGLPLSLCFLCCWIYND